MILLRRRESGPNRPDFSLRRILSALGDHLSLVREHYRVPERIAIVGDKAWQRMAEKIMSKFLNAQTKFFDSGDYNGAVAWVAV
jgi:hypothetical protein